MWSKMHARTLILLVILQCCTPSLSQSNDVCGSQIGYNLTSMLSQGIHVWNGYNSARIEYNVYPCQNPEGIATYCKNDQSAISGCAYSPYNNAVTQTYGQPYYGYSTNVWEFVNSSNYLEGFTWSTPYLPVPSTYILRRARVVFTCHPDATTPWINFGGGEIRVISGGQYQEYHTMGVTVLSNIFCNASALNASVSSSSSSTGSYQTTGTDESSTAAVIQSLSSSSTGSSVQNSGIDGSSTSVVMQNLSTSTGLAPGCGNSLQTWYFSYFALISSTHSIHFYGTFYTSSIIPVNLLVVQVVQIQATWTLTLNGVSTSVLVTVLNQQVLSGINMGGSSLYPLQSQSWSFYVGTELVTIGGTGIYPVIVNGETVQAGGFMYSNNPMGPTPCQ